MIATSQLPAIVAGRYVPIRLIARGGMAAVYEVEHARTGERLALKVLLSSAGASPEELERFKREARASTRIKSENVVRVTDADIAPELDGAPFLVMELLEGEDLERLAAATLPAPATVVEWLRQVARAIDKAHRLGIVHRDLKPQNLFLATADDRPPMVKVLDFGIAKLVGDGTGATGSGQILGTPKYMAPEQAVANARVTPATDRYSLGLIAYRLLTGESYYQGDVMTILGQLLHGELQPPSKRSPRFGGRFDVWFGKACDRNPDKRFASAAEQVEALAEALGQPTAPLETASLGNQKSRRALLATATLAAVLVAGTLVYRRLSAGKLDGSWPSATATTLIPAALRPTAAFRADAPRPALGPRSTEVRALNAEQSSPAEPTSKRVSREPGSHSRRAPTRNSDGSKESGSPDPLAEQK
jgi:eukaryotic-like serine/threonine-protein kinase